MKKCLPVLLFLLPLVTRAGEKDSSTIYYDRSWEILVDDGPDVFYYRKAIKKEDVWYVNDYYKAGNKLQMSGAYKLYLDSAKTGTFKYYSESGQLKEEGAYVDGKKNGVWKEWHENGKLKSTANFSDDYMVGKFEGWWDDGTRYCSEQYLEDIDKIKSYEKKDTAGKVIEISGVPVGTCEYYFQNGVMSSREVWKNNVLTALEIWNEKGAPETPARDKNGELVANVVPEFKGGLDALMRYLSSHIEYPKQSRKRNESGRCNVQFVVNKDGSISRVWVYKSSGYPLLDKETVRVVLSMSGKWTPGKQHNQSVSVYYTLPVTFRLQD